LFAFNRYEKVDFACVNVKNPIMDEDCLNMGLCVSENSLLRQFYKVKLAPTQFLRL
jgi:hypothetical protein